MDEMTMFADLRPDHVHSVDLTTLRTELFPDTAPVDNVIEWERRATRHDPRRRLALAAATIVAIGVGGVWAVAGRGPSPEPVTPAAPAADNSSTPTTPVTDEAESPTSSASPPLVQLTEPGWILTSAWESTRPGSRAAVMLSDAGFAGPWVEITADTNYDAATAPVTVPSNQPDIALGGSTARVNDYGDGVFVYWTAPDGTHLTGHGWGVNAEQVGELLVATEIREGVVAVNPLPTGATWVVDGMDSLGRFPGYRYTHTDGRTVEFNFAAGGARAAHYFGADNHNGRGAYAPVDVAGSPGWLADYNFTADPPDGVSAAEAEPATGQYRLVVEHEFWTWQAMATNFGSGDDLTALVAAANVVDQTTWEAGLPPAIVGSFDRPGAWADALSGIPTPPGFDPTSHEEGFTKDRYQFLVEVTQAVGCAWTAEIESGDPARETAAKNALATVAGWPILAEIGQQGSWDQVFLAWADGMVNGAADPTSEQAAVELPTGTSCRGLVD